MAWSGVSIFLFINHLEIYDPKDELKENLYDCTTIKSVYIHKPCLQEWVRIETILYISPSALTYGNSCWPEWEGRCEVSL